MASKEYSYGRHNIDEEDIAAVVRVLKGDFLTQGPEISLFEEELAKRFGAKHAIAVNSGTAALHLSLLALGLGKGDLVLVPSITFAASANSAVYCGCDVELLDVDPNTGRLTPSILTKKISDLKLAGRHPKALVAVDYAGHPCDWTELQKIALEHSLALVDDACHALGARWAGKEIYGATFADVVCGSFHPVKHITTGEGGAILTNRDDIATAARDLRSHGIVKDPARLSQNHGPWYYEMQSLGFNYRLPDLQAALGRSQLSKLDSFVARRRKIADEYRHWLAGDSRLDLVPDSSQAFHSYHLFPALLPEAMSLAEKAKLFASLKAAGLHLQVHYVPVHMQPYYQAKIGAPVSLPGAESFYRREISLPIHPGLNSKDIEEICVRLRSVLQSHASA